MGQCIDSIIKKKYIYIYIERERERPRDRVTPIPQQQQKNHNQWIQFLTNSVSGKLFKWQWTYPLGGQNELTTGKKQERETDKLLTWKDNQSKSARGVAKEKDKAGVKGDIKGKQTRKERRRVAHDFEAQRKSFLMSSHWNTYKGQKKKKSFGTIFKSLA